MVSWTRIGDEDGHIMLISEIQFPVVITKEMERELVSHMS